jgi:hypothetical protein
LKKYHYFVAYDVFNDKTGSFRKGNGVCWTTAKIETLDDIEIVEKRLTEKEGNEVIVNNFKMLKVEY